MNIKKTTRILTIFIFTSSAIVLPIDNFYTKYSIVAIVLLWLLFLFTGKLKFPKHITIFIVIFFILSLIQAFFRGFPYKNVIITLGGLIIYSSSVYSVFNLHKNEIYKLIKVYLNVAYYASLFAIFQEITYLFNFGSDFNWLFNGYAPYTYSGPFLKVPSIFTEPGYFAPFLIPAVYISLKHFIKNGRDLNTFKALCIIFALLFTFSLIGYIGLLASILFIFRSNIKHGLIIGIIIIGISIIYIPSINSRILAILNFSTTESIENSNTSSLIILLNLNIALHSFIENPFFGTGFDSYESISIPILKNEITSQLLIDLPSKISDQGLMLKEGGNLFFRMIVEIGIIGILIIFLFFKRKLVPKGENRDIQFMCFVFFLSYSFRTGNYMNFELWYFIILFQSLNIDFNKKNIQAINSNR